jgi:hypothetical protein
MGADGGTLGERQEPRVQCSGPANAQCRTREAACDALEGFCFCVSSAAGDPCGLDKVGHDEGAACVCGHCQ